jgi:hypothetical protein
MPMRGSCQRTAKISSVTMLFLMPAHYNRHLGPVSCVDGECILGIGSDARQEFKIALQQKAAAGLRRRQLFLDRA